MCEHVRMQKEGPIWMVRAGEGGSYIDDFRRLGVVGIGWAEPGDVRPGTPDTEIASRFQKAYPDWSESTRRSSAGQVRRFVNELKEGQSVATYEPDRRRYLLGEIAGPPAWRDERPQRTRRVEWLREVSRDSLTPSTKNSLGSTMTLFRLGPDVAREMWDKSVSLGSPDPTQSSATSTPDQLEIEEQVIVDDQEEKANSAIEDSIVKLNWEEMQELVAAVLRAMGYKTKVFGPGDRGRDVFASPDGLGLQEPRIFVEVKHRVGTKIGAPEIRSFLGGRRPGDRCLYVSTGGFAKDAHYEADRSAIPLTLVTLSDLRELVVQHYERFDSVGQALVPLRRMYWPVK